MSTHGDLPWLADRLVADGVGNVERWSRQWQHATADRRGDYAAEAYCALALRKVGLFVEFADADPPDLWVSIDARRFGVETRNFREKKTDVLDRAEMQLAQSRGLLAVYGQTELREGKAAREQVVAAVDRKLSGRNVPIDYVMFHSDSSCVEEIDVRTARNELADRCLSDPRLQKLRGIALMSNWISLRERRSFWYFPMPGVDPNDSIERALRSIAKWQDAVRGSFLRLGGEGA